MLMPKLCSGDFKSYMLYLMGMRMKLDKTYNAFWSIFHFERTNDRNIMDPNV